MALQNRQVARFADVLSRVDLTVLPLLFVGLFVFQLDRMNLASALTAGFATDIHIDQATVNLGNQLMFTGIVLFEIPSNMLLQRVSYITRFQNQKVKICP